VDSDNEDEEEDQIPKEWFKEQIFNRLNYADKQRVRKTLDRRREKELAKPERINGYVSEFSLTGNMTFSFTSPVLAPTNATDYQNLPSDILWIDL